MRTLFNSSYYFTTENIENFKKQIAEVCECDINEITDECIYLHLNEQSNDDLNYVCETLQDIAGSNNYFCCVGNVQIWQGTFIGKSKFCHEEILDLIKSINYDNLIIKYESGIIYLEFVHHDGIHVMQLRTINKRLKRFADSFGYDYESSFYEIQNSKSYFYTSNPFDNKRNIIKKTFGIK